MRIEVEVGDATTEEAAKLAARFAEQSAELLRKMRRQLQYGDHVRDRWGQLLWVSHVFRGEKGPEYELRNFEHEKIWKAARDSDIEEVL